MEPVNYRAGHVARPHFDWHQQRPTGLLTPAAAA